MKSLRPLPENYSAIVELSLVRFSFQVFHSQRGQGAEGRVGKEGGWEATQREPPRWQYLSMPAADQGLAPRFLLCQDSVTV